MVGGMVGGMVVSIFFFMHCILFNPYLLLISENCSPYDIPQVINVDPVKETEGCIFRAFNKSYVIKSYL